MTCDLGRHANSQHQRSSTQTGSKPHPHDLSHVTKLSLDDFYDSMTLTAVPLSKALKSVVAGLLISIASVSSAFSK